MLSIPSSRKLAYPALLLLAIIATARLFFGLRLPNSEEAVTRILLHSSQKSVQIIQLSYDVDFQQSLDNIFVAQYHSEQSLPVVNPLLINLLSECRHNVNPYTSHIRLSSVPILNISMVPTGQASDLFRDKRYFNPAIIPLPSYVTTSTSYRYLLVSRLVTTGSHQESHICFADVCTYDNPSISTGTRSCTDDDLDVLGHGGGMRCITTPEKLNIPPTPSQKCTGVWSTFPHIPGFHDPRVFWSGRGEPLIEVNSGSAYGCVGLWMVDLRAVFPALDEVLKKRRQGAEQQEKEDSEAGKDEGLDMVALGASMQYKYLTEITRNPRNSRAEVEKNWVLFFPTEDEAWVQYDMMGKVQGQLSEIPHGLGDVPKMESTFTIQSASSSTTSLQPTESTFLDQQSSLNGSSGTLSTHRQGSAEFMPHDTPKTSQIQQAAMSTSVLAEAIPSSISQVSVIPLEDGPARRALISKPVHTEIVYQPDIVPPVSLPASENHVELSSKTVMRLVSETASTAPSAVLYNNTSHANTSTSFSNTPPHTASDQRLHHIGGRGIAQLSSHGHTTPNLTHPLEPSCFDHSNPFLTSDKLNNTGHWHQGSNSLRLVICTHEQFRQRACIPNSQDSHKPLNRHDYAELLSHEGLIIHLSIVHRKFTNAWKLPMRYERYLLLWEARKPYRMIGVSRYPLLFENERARPWSWEEDKGWDEWHRRREARSIEEEEEIAYFTYTPSIAWAWRAKGEDEGLSQDRGHEDLGTGFLGEDVIVGIGMDDTKQGFVGVKVDVLLGCMRLCPGVA